MAKDTCPHCGNDNQKTIESNGVPRTHHDYALLCVARVNPSRRAMPDADLDPEDIDARGLVKCGMQWCPNA